MKEGLISYQTAVLAKEAGFQYEYDADDHDNWDEGYHSYFQYRRDDQRIFPLSHLYADTSQNIQQWIDLKTPAPTQSQLQKWFREKHNINVFVGFRLNVKRWDADVYPMHLSGIEYAKARGFKRFRSRPSYATYEEALEGALQEAFDLIKQTNEGSDK